METFTSFPDQGGLSMAENPGMHPQGMSLCSKESEMKQSGRVRHRGAHLTAALLVSALASLLWAYTAQADQLSLGSTYNTINFTNQASEGGGSVGPSFLNGNALVFVYCADVYTTVNVPGTYYTYVSTDGAIHKTSVNAAGVAVTNADQVAWLVEHYAFGAVTDTMKQKALQAAIWHEIYGGFTPSDSNVEALFAMYVAAIPGNVPNTEHTHVQWLSPVDSNDSPAQGLVTITTPTITTLTITTPEPATLFLLASGCAGLLALGWRWRRRAA